jgi:1-acyl-sn-glycerol-3-phosphate acyltransferase
VEQSRVTSSTAIAPNYGIDADRVLAIDRPSAWVRRRLEGRFAVDEFGGDPHLMDLLAPIPAATIRVDVEHRARVPRTGPALLVSNRGLGLAEPLVLGLAVRRAAGRRLRIIGAPEVPVLGPFTRKLGAIGYRPDDVAGVLRAGHLAGAPLGMTWLRSGAGEPPRALLAATLGFPVVPVAIRPGGPFGLPFGVWPTRPWRVVVGEALLPPPGTSLDDQLAAAELAEQVRDAIVSLLREAA